MRVCTLLLFPLCIASFFSFFFFSFFLFFLPPPSTPIAPYLHLLSPVALLLATLWATYLCVPKMGKKTKKKKNLFPFPFLVSFSSSLKWRIYSHRCTSTTAAPPPLPLHCSSQNESHKKKKKKKKKLKSWSRVTNESFFPLCCLYPHLTLITDPCKNERRGPLCDGKPRRAHLSPPSTAVAAAATLCADYCLLLSPSLIRSSRVEFPI